MNPQYPVYIPSKGRWESRLTVKALEKIHVPYFIVVEKEEYELYAQVIDLKKILVLPVSNLGIVASRNWIWDHARSSGAEWHWIIDDNIRIFFRYHHNRIIQVGSGTIFRCAEDFVDRYENVAEAGFNYEMFCISKDKNPPYYLNTRIYSCILLRNDIQFTWRGVYNEDTDLSLRLLKAGWCTILFNAFLAKKMVTMSMKGGNTTDLYLLGEGKPDGRLLMAQSLVAQHPDVASITWKWGRFQHHVNYKKFKNLYLKRKKNIKIPDGPNNYGMVLKENINGEWVVIESKQYKLQHRKKQDRVRLL